MIQANLPYADMQNRTLQYQLVKGPVDLRSARSMTQQQQYMYRESSPLCSNLFMLTQHKHGPLIGTRPLLCECVYNLLLTSGAWLLLWGYFEGLCCMMATWLTIKSLLYMPATSHVFLSHLASEELFLQHLGSIFRDFRQTQGYFKIEFRYQ